MQITFGIIVFLAAIFYIIVISFYWLIATEEIYEVAHKLNKWFDPWEMGECRGRLSRRNRYTSFVYFVMYDQHRNQHWYRFRMCYWCFFKPHNLRKEKYQ